MQVRNENSQICIEFFDVRAAQAALRGLNGFEIAGRQLKLAPSCPEGIRWLSIFLPVLVFLHGCELMQ